MRLKPKSLQPDTSVEIPNIATLEWRENKRKTKSAGGQQEQQRRSHAEQFTWTMETQLKQEVYARTSPSFTCNVAVVSNTHPCSTLFYLHSTVPRPIGCTACLGTMVFAASVSYTERPCSTISSGTLNVNLSWGANWARSRMQSSR